MTFRSAGRYEIVRSAHKDEQVCSQLRDSALEVALHLLRPQTLLKHKNLVEIATDVAYFSLTTLNDLQTLGEEYVHLLQVDSTKKQLPTKKDRACMIFYQVVCPYFINKFVQTTNFTIFNFIQRCHLAYFYLNGGVYHLSKKLNQIHYVLLRDWLKYSPKQNVFRILGLLLSLQLIAEFLTKVLRYTLIVGHRSSDSYSLGDRAHHVWSYCTGRFSEMVAEQTAPVLSFVPPEKKCPLCLDCRDRTTCTQCGHLFCWKCIVAWMETTFHCPICREALHPSTVVLLNNYDHY